ncbi:TetR/AcrR family transcriptional regulator [Mumia sp. DW29H23]|uniref:TetR/AcrR family transcriptional regulator n=1 Tax=Mumia sp. DW29H23 TaxID=3421241 RepID=UPI003D69D2EE
MPDREPVSPPPRRRSERARTAVLGAAAELVEEVPYAKVTVEAIAARAGVGKQTIYRWWPSRGAVVFDALLARAGGAEAPLPDTGDLRADLSTFLGQAVTAMTAPHEDAFLRAVTVEILQDATVAAQYRERLMVPQRAAVRSRLESAQVAGEIRAGTDLDVLVECLLGPVVGRWVLGSGDLDTAYAHAVVGLVLDGAVR